MTTALRLTPVPLLRRFVQAHERDLQSLGEDLSDDPRRLFTALRVESLPDPMREAINRIEVVAAHGSADLLLVADGALSEARDMDACSLAVAAWLDHPVAFERAHHRCISRPMWRIREFLGRTTGAPTILDSRAVEDLARRFGHTFDSWGWSSHCSVEQITSNRTHSFLVWHGGALCREEALATEPGMLAHDGVVQYRPRQRDLVIYDPRRGRLKVDAPDASTLHLYRTGFGDLLFQDAGWFGVEPVVSLAPLVELGREALLPAGEVVAVALTSIEVCLCGDPGANLTVHGTDVFGILDMHGLVDLRDAMLRAASIRVRLAGGKSGTVEIRPPNHVLHDLRFDEGAIEDFLEERGFLAARDDQRAP